MKNKWKMNDAIKCKLSQTGKNTTKCYLMKN